MRSSAALNLPWGHGEKNEENDVASSMKQTVYHFCGRGSRNYTFTSRKRGKYSSDNDEKYLSGDESSYDNRRRHSRNSHKRSHSSCHNSSRGHHHHHSSRSNSKSRTNNKWKGWMEYSSSSRHENHHSPEYNHSRGCNLSENGEKCHSSAGYNLLDDNGFGDATAGVDTNLSVSLSQNSKPVSDT